MTNEDDTETTDAGSSLSTFERWIRLYVPQNEDDSAEFLPADVATDLALADNEEAVTGVELTVDGVNSAAEMSTFLEAFGLHRFLLLPAAAHAFPREVRRHSTTRTLLAFREECSVG